MSIEHHHDLTIEFPEYKDRIHELKMHDHHFSRLYQEYEDLDKEIYRIEENIETPSDDYTEELKLRRIKLKDELYNMIKAGE